MSLHLFYRLNQLNSCATCQVLQISTTIPQVPGARLHLSLKPSADAGPEAGLLKGEWALA